jgi:DNA-binding transcriptional ArsR family regulator
MESAFTVLAEPSRRAILTLLASGERSVGDLESALNLSQPSVSKHLRVLRDAGLVEATIDAQRRVYRSACCQAAVQQLNISKRRHD